MDSRAVDIRRPYLSRPGDTPRGRRAGPWARCLPLVGALLIAACGSGTLSGGGPGTAEDGLAPGWDASFGPVSADAGLQPDALLAADATPPADQAVPDSAPPVPDAAPPAPDTAPPGPPVKQVLDIVWKGQETGYWCGPGSTRIALSAKMSASSLPSQATLASYMGTTTNGTNHIGLVRNALNKYLNTSHYGSYPMTDPPSSQQRALLKKHLVDNISNGWAMVGNVISGWRPPGYPSGTIYHYISIVGYDESGDKALIADPAGEGAGGSKWVNVPRTYWISTWDLGTWIGGKGYAG